MITKRERKDTSTTFGEIENRHAEMTEIVIPAQAIKSPLPRTIIISKEEKHG